ncbi:MULTISPECIES: cell division FtsA domain-containing protein [unclassified Sedimentibacter]|uniref:cell division FtsA domain-containing protein n=1 Tax=unclassified Sedimentibacter TaxID=2649220 RepID=UPI0027E1BE18|nr:cell division FtsA domain-containing protein [Sedimentibacter sp. MB35-C1]WMJ78625.1 cell division FtsA domain-containing protein [Sedimentibacter sp. MB35-C1]
MNDYIFSLDIGTRSVVGVVCDNEENTLKIRSIKSILHKQRSMVDGQIENIKEVSRVIGTVKGELEEELGIELERVSIAAAGRALKTERIMLEKNIDIRSPLTAEFISAMETEALKLAQDIFIKNSEKDLFYCVGYSVLGYKLDGKTMSNIEGHRGNMVSVEIIAAFLPHTVIEGLYSCMDNNGLEVCNLTLEPIAAMDLIIPPELRLLNLVLVDIGAGTSDIAISKAGSVVGYDMATIAGDEITECIMKNYLVDFKAAEEIKFMLNEVDEYISVTNVLGITQDISKDEILESIKTAVYDLCADLAEKISKMNKETPAAVFLAGGGSKTPFIREFLSELLNIPNSRIALTDKKSLRNVDLNSLSNFGPELITPLGIAYSVILNRNYDFFSVKVNNKKVRLYGIKQMKVMDAILMSGFDTKKLIGFSGKSLRFTVDGKEHYYAGEFSTPCQIYVNSVSANIESEIQPGDTIEIIPAKDGATHVIKISDIVEESNSGIVYFNGVPTELCSNFFVNDTEVDKDYVIGNSDVLKIIQLKNISDLYKLYNLDEKEYKSYINGIEADLEYKLYDGLKVDILKIEPVIANKAEKEVPKEELILDSFISVTVNGKKIQLPKRDNGSPYIFADMLTFTNIDPSNPKGNIVLIHNGNEASYLNPIAEDDNIVIKWDSEYTK